MDIVSSQSVPPPSNPEISISTIADDNISGSSVTVVIDDQPDIDKTPRKIAQNEFFSSESREASSTETSDTEFADVVKREISAERQRQRKKSLDNRKSAIGILSLKSAWGSIRREGSVSRKSSLLKNRRMSSSMSRLSDLGKVDEQAVGQTADENIAETITLKPQTANYVVATPRDEPKMAENPSALANNRPLNNPLSRLKDEVQMRKTRSLSDLLMKAKINESMDDLARNGTAKKFDALSAEEQQREHAAITIQTFWRYQRLRNHFATILDNVMAKEQHPSPRTRRKSVILWMIAKDFSKSHERLHVKRGTGTTEILQSPPGSELDLTKSQSPLHQPSSPSESRDNFDDGPIPSLQSPNSPPVMDKRRLLNKLINVFNMDSSKGMKRLISEGCISCSPEDIADFLFQDQRLSKSKIGEYIGAGEDLQNKVLRSFVKHFDFSGLDFDDALRAMLKTFRLPGEAQKIDRVMNEFAQRYCLGNPEVFSTPDTAYVLAYSLIMLNTDAHNPSVKKKMTLQDFLRNNRGIDNKKNLPEDFMKKLFSNIVGNEIKMNDQDNVYLLGEISSQIAGKFDNIVAPHRMFVREYNAVQITEYDKQNLHRHDRSIFIFNDLLLILKPRVAPTLSSSGGAAEYSFAATLTSATPSIRSEAFKYHFRHQFNMINMLATKKPDNQFHTNVLEIANSNGRLLTLGFYSPAERDSFYDELMENVIAQNDLEDDKLKKMKDTSVQRSLACRCLMEEIYSFDDEKALNRFNHFPNLRHARCVLNAKSAIIMGKKKQLGAPVFPEVARDEPFLTEFGHKIMLGVPSPCPEPENLQPSPTKETEATTVVQDEADFDTIAALSPLSEKVVVEVPQDRKRARRNTIVG